MVYRRGDVVPTFRFDGGPARILTCTYRCRPRDRKCGCLVRGRGKERNVGELDNSFDSCSLSYRPVLSYSSIKGAF